MILYYTWAFTFRTYGHERLMMTATTKPMRITRYHHSPPYSHSTVPTADCPDSLSRHQISLGNKSFSNNAIVRWHHYYCSFILLLNSIRSNSVYAVENESIHMFCTIASYHFVKCSSTNNNNNHHHNKTSNCGKMASLLVYLSQYKCILPNVMRTGKKCALRQYLYLLVFLMYSNYILL